MWFTYFCYWIYTLVSYAIDVTMILYLKSYCLEQICQMLETNLIKRKKTNLNENIKFPAVEYIDVYSIKAMGKLRKFFITHWKGEAIAL